MDSATVHIAFPGLDGTKANQFAQDLVDDLRQNVELQPHLDIGRTKVTRTNREAQDFGATLVAVLSAPALVIFAKAVKSWIERTGASTIEINGIRIENVRSENVAAIVNALQVTSPSDTRVGQCKGG